MSFQVGGRLALGERRPCRDYEHVRVAHQLDRLVRPLAEREVRERDVELATFDEPEELLVVGGLGQRDSDLRPGFEEAAHHLGQDALADALVDADAERAGLAFREGGEVGLGRGHSRSDGVGVDEEEPAGLGERDGLRAAGPLDQPVADDALEGRDLLADRRLGVAERGGCLAEGAFPGDGFQRQEMP